MRKLKLQVQMSVDGYIGGPNGEMDWLTFPWTDDINSYVAGIMSDITTIILGRNLAEGFIPHWANVAADPDHPEIAGGRVFTDTPKVVFSRTLTESKWENTVVAQDVVAEVTKLKQKEGGDIYAYGGSEFVSSLIRNRLVDEYFLFINPVALGKGMPIFEELETKQNLTLVESVAFDCGIVALHFQLKT
ncbi:MAG: dihydrofolate reductase family protein [Saprospiraceae bacterium]